MSQRLLFPLVLACALVGWLTAIAAGDVAWIGSSMAILKSAFLSMLKLIVAPLVFLSLLSGILQLNRAQEVGRLGGVALGYYLGTTSIAIALGLSVVYWLHPWTGAPPIATPDPSGLELIDAGSDSYEALFVGLVQQMFVNPFAALAELNILGIVTNGVLIGLALMVTLPNDSPVVVGIHHLTNAVYRLAGWAVWLVPFGVMAIIFDVSVSADANLLRQLLAFAAVVVGATLLHGLVVLPTIGWVFAGLPPHRFARAAARPFLVALTTSSSAATLPVTMESARGLGVHPIASSFVLPLGATINMDGTALFEGIAAVFLAHLFGIELNAVTTTTVFLVAMLASIGAPGIPSGSMAGMQMVLLAVGIPLEAIGILLLVERPLDTIRTAVNVEGDLVGSLVVDRFARLR